MPIGEIFLLSLMGGVFLLSVIFSLVMIKMGVLW